MRPSVGEEVEVTIENWGINGEGVARVRGWTLFVESALPGERVRVRIGEVRSSFARGEVIEVLQASPRRIKPVCGLFGRCGGCQLMHVDYAGQLEAKRGRVVDALERIGKWKGEVAECVPSPLELGYRNKIQLPVSEKGRLGLYARGSHDLVEIEGCGIHCALGEKVLKGIQGLIQDYPVKHVLIKTAVNRQEVLVVLVTRGQELLRELAQQILGITSEIKGVVQNINPSEKNVILGHEFHTLAGQGWIEESLNGLVFKVSPASFFQVNPLQAEALYQAVLQEAQLTGRERVLDAYCGVGTLALMCAQRAHEVIGIESVQEAIEDAKENALRNQICNAQFICGAVEEKIASWGVLDVAIVNPPRKGCDRAVLEALLASPPRRIIYVSCDPATLARDVQILIAGGYCLNRVQPFDMFPQTMHVECVASLEVKNESAL